MKGESVILDPGETLSAFEARLSAAIARARARRRPVLATLTRDLGEARNPAAFAAARGRQGNIFFSWSRTAPAPLEIGAAGAAVTARFTRAGLGLRDGAGRAVALPPASHARFEAMETACSWIFDGALAGPTTGARGPLFVGGFSFDPRSASDAAFPAARLWIPRTALVRERKGTSLTLAWLARETDAPSRILPLFRDDLTAAGAPQPDARGREPGTTGVSLAPAQATWRRGVEAALREIADGAYEKIVLTRRCRVTAGRAFDPFVLYGRLRAAFPSCLNVALGFVDDSFVCASPELLARRRGRRVRSESLAGSIARGATPAEDRRLARTLIESKKDHAEHEIVVRWIRSALAPRCSRLSAPESPHLARLKNVQHLTTPVTGLLRERIGILRLVEALHPTPAVGGSPGDPTLALIRARERWDRGWYAGPVGWLNAAREGEFAVAIRSARLRGAEAELLAGAGIVQGSDPRAELEETDLKLRALLGALVDR
jgi:salicylate biosynthesis isochorismate synthase/menaquinone-specific isochorismate synthase